MHSVLASRESFSWKNAVIRFGQLFRRVMLWRITAQKPIKRSALPYRSSPFGKSERTRIKTTPFSVRSINAYGRNTLQLVVYMNA